MSKDTTINKIKKLMPYYTCSNILLPEINSFNPHQTAIIGLLVNLFTNTNFINHHVKKYLLFNGTRKELSDTSKIPEGTIAEATKKANDKIHKVFGHLYFNRHEDIIEYIKSADTNGLSQLVLLINSLTDTYKEKSIANLLILDIPDIRQARLDIDETKFNGKMQIVCSVSKHRNKLILESDIIKIHEFINYLEYLYQTSSEKLSELEKERKKLVLMLIAGQQPL